MNFFKNIWYQFCSWDEKQTDSRKKKLDDSSKETYNKEALENINAVPNGDGYVVVFNGFIISEKLDSANALKLVDIVRKNYIDKKMNNTKEIWY